jgi:hypothetical protein
MTDEAEVEIKPEVVAEEVKAPPKKEISMSQFKSWLEGVEEMQEDGWHPSATQWKTIRAKFDMITEPRPAPAPARAAAGPMPAYQQPHAQPAPAWEAAPPMPETEVSAAARAIMTGGKPQEVDSADGNFDSPFG